METVGYLGAFLLAVCAFPQFVMSIKQGHSNGLNKLFLNSWLLGEILMLIFVVNSIGASGPLFYNYAANTVFLLVIVYYRYNPRRVSSISL